MPTDADLQTANVIAMGWLTQRREFADSIVANPDATEREREMARIVAAMIEESIEDKRRVFRLLTNVRSIVQSSGDIVRQLEEYTSTLPASR